MALIVVVINKSKIYLLRIARVETDHFWRYAQENLLVHVRKIFLVRSRKNWLSFRQYKDTTRNPLSASNWRSNTAKIAHGNFCNTLNISTLIAILRSDSAQIRANYRYFIPLLHAVTP